MADSVWYPSVEDIVAIHDDIVSEYPDTPSGTQNRGDIEFALDYIEEGTFSSAPKTIHRKAFHLLRLLVANPSLRRCKRAYRSQRRGRLLLSQRLSVRIR